MQAARRLVRSLSKEHPLTRRTLLAVLALAALTATQADAAFNGSIYYTNYSDHHVRRLDVAGSVAGVTTDLAALPGADGLMFDPTDPARLLVGGQLHNDIYSLSTSGGAYSILNSSPIINGAFHLTDMKPAAPVILASSQEGPQMNGLALIDRATGSVDNRLITGTLAGRVSGVKVRELPVTKSHGGGGEGEQVSVTQRREFATGETVYITDSPNTGIGGHIYTVDLATNVATLVNVQANGPAVSHDVHSLWMDKLTGHMFAAGAKHVEEIDLDALGGPMMVREWDLSALIPETPSDGGHIDQISSDGFGNMFAASNAGEIIYMDLTSGAATPTLLEKAADITVDDIVAGPSSVPEPTSLLLAGLGLASLRLLKKRA